MSVQTVCPKCEKKLKVADNLLSENIMCPGCDTVFSARTPESSISTASPPQIKRSPNAPSKLERQTDEDDEGIASRPLIKATPKPAVDDRPKRPHRGKDDDDEQRSLKRGKQKGSGIILHIIVGAIGLFVCLGGCWLIYYAATKPVNDLGEVIPNVADPRLQGADRIPPWTDAEDLAGPWPAIFPPGWKEVREDKYGFSVMMPGTPTQGLRNEENRADFTLDWPPGRGQLALKNGYWINIAEYKGFAKGANVENFVASLTNVGMWYVDGTRSTHVKKGMYAGKLGLAWDVEPGRGGGVWRFRACLADDKVFTLGAGRDGSISKADAEKFFASFKVLSK
jgi:hypothetical protein